MKLKRVLSAFLVLALSLSLLASCGSKANTPDDTSSDAVEEDYHREEIVMPEELPIPEGECGHAYLYGEEHAKGQYLMQELKLWQNYYREKGMRHLCVELPYYAAELLNLWMQADDDEILDALFDDFSGTKAGTSAMRSFYQVIKEICPDTIFHGTDVGRSEGESGERYLTYLKEEKQEDSENYTIAVNCIEQGRYFSREGLFDDDEYREAMMAHNFARTLASLNGEDVMGIYGAAHINETRNEDAEANRMVVRLQDDYHISVTCEDLRDREYVRLTPKEIPMGEKTYSCAPIGETVAVVDGELQVRSFLCLWDAWRDYGKSDVSGLGGTPSEEGAPGGAPSGMGPSQKETSENNTDENGTEPEGRTMLSSEFPQRIDMFEVYAILTLTDDGNVDYSYFFSTSERQGDDMVLREIIP